MRACTVTAEKQIFIGIALGQQMDIKHRRKKAGILKMETTSRTINQFCIRVVFVTYPYLHTS